MLKFGKISSIDSTKGLYQITFDEDQLVSGWIPANVRNSKDNKDESGYDQDEHVSCLMDENCEYGVVLGAIYDEANPPVIGNADIVYKKFKDGSFIQYDRSAKKFTGSFEGDVEIIKSKNIHITTSEKVTINADSIVLNDGNNKGIPKVISLKTKLNNIENKINAILGLLTAWVPVPNDGGVALKTAFSALVSTTLALLTLTTQADIENTKATH